MSFQKFLLTGLPGVGKTTVVIKTAELLKENVAGFYTAEIRGRKTRLGFEIVTFSGKKSTLAHIDFPTKYKVGKYGLKPENLEEALLEIKNALHQKEVSGLIIDEIGKMEFYHPDFQKTVVDVFESDLPVIATIMKKPHPFCDFLKRQEDVELIEVTRENRDELPPRLVEKICSY